jgi:hypothetical protein
MATITRIANWFRRTFIVGKPPEGYRAKCARELHEQMAQLRADGRGHLIDPSEFTRGHVLKDDAP